MKIAGVRVWKENLRLSRPYTIAYQRIDKVENIFLLIRLDNGVAGIGSASPAEAVTGESLDACQTCLEELAGELIGEDIRSFSGIISRALRDRPDRPAALAALDIALHDAFCQFLGLPLTSYLGRVHEGLPTSVTLGIGPLDETLEEARAFIASGFRAIKLKTGLDAEADLETCRELRSLLGEHIPIRVDANQGYGMGDILHFANRSGDLDLELIEQPLPKDSIETMRRLPESLRKRCAADESLQRPEDALMLSREPQPFGIYNIKLMKCGGVKASLDIAGIAQLAGIDLMWGCNDESAVSITAALHAALACPATRYLDLDGSLDLLHDIVDGGFILRDGCLFPGEGSGLGLHLKHISPEGA